MLTTTNIKETPVIPKRLTIEEARAQGYTIDTTVYPPFAYKGYRFSPDDRADCYTELEAELITDARRYHFLRDADLSVMNRPCVAIQYTEKSGIFLSGDDVDKAVDEARLTANESNKEIINS